MDLIGNALDKVIDMIVDVVVLDGRGKQLGKLSELPMDPFVVQDNIVWPRKPISVAITRKGCACSAIFRDRKGRDVVRKSLAGMEVFPTDTVVLRNNQ